jgi:hypothetical protein
MTTTHGLTNNSTNVFTGNRSRDTGRYAGYLQLDAGNNMVRSMVLIGNREHWSNIPGCCSGGIQMTPALAGSGASLLAPEPPPSVLSTDTRLYHPDARPHISLPKK